MLRYFLRKGGYIPMGVLDEVEKVNSEGMLAEFFGTLVLSFAVLASINSNAMPLLIPPFAAAITLGLIVLLMGGISGGHFNPAVTTGLYILRKTNIQNTIAYIFAQMTGALLALVIYTLFNGGDPYTAPVIAATDARTFWAEFFGAVIFGFGVASVVVHKRKDLEMSFGIGLSLLIGLLFASLGSSAVLNPAVALAVDSVSWTYIFGPVLGAAAGMLLFTVLLPPGTLTNTLTKKAPTLPKATPTSSSASVAKSSAKTVAPKKTTSSKKKTTKKSAPKTKSKK